MATIEEIAAQLELQLHDATAKVSPFTLEMAHAVRQREGIQVGTIQHVGPFLSYLFSLQIDEFVAQQTAHLQKATQDHEQLMRDMEGAYLSRLSLFALRIMQHMCYHVLPYASRTCS